MTTDRTCCPHHTQPEKGCPYCSGDPVFHGPVFPCPSCAKYRAALGDSIESESALRRRMERLGDERDRLAKINYTLNHALRSIAGSVGEFAHADGKNVVEKIDFLRDDWKYQVESMEKYVVSGIKFRHELMTENTRLREELSTLHGAIREMDANLRRRAGEQE